jgi:hypothetical protein
MRPRGLWFLGVSLVAAIAVSLWWTFSGPHSDPPTWFSWLAFVWAELVGIAIAWVSYLGYRKPRGNRATAWLDDLNRWWYRSTFGDSPGASDFSWESMLQSAVICGGLVIFFAVVALVGAIK